MHLSVFLKFNKIFALTNKTEDIAIALEKSDILKLSEDRLKVCRTTPIKEKENEDDCTIYVERLPEDTTHDWLKEIFSIFGTVDYISLPKYKHNKRHKGFAFIEFADPEIAQKAIAYLESIGCKLPTQMPPNHLASIITFELDNAKSKHAEENQTTETTDENIIFDHNVPNNDAIESQNTNKKKRKLSLKDEEIEKKKLKKDDTDDNCDDDMNKTDDNSKKDGTDKEEEFNQEDVVPDGIKRKRKRKKSKKNHCDFTQMGLQVLSK